MISAGLSLLPLSFLSTILFEDGGLQALGIKNLVDSDGFVGFLIQITATESAVSNAELSEREAFIDLGHDFMELGVATIADVIYSNTSEAGELAILVEVAVQTRVPSSVR